uniref:Serine-threonine kinase receptor-associated protein n=1 Tax=Lotharella globosa TaxID=91324 RepID=A0A6V3U2L6_9EUKA|mmetsp:Transcript_1631/g.3093  ORF Transcript_1631/g.3093 Transcript_1631/m.3093 type:complete len:345 (+) Transcript_1631:69-1103(+)
MTTQATQAIVMAGHERPITQVKYNLEGDLIFSSSKDSFATCWRSDTGDRLGTYDGHKGAINTLDIDRKTKYLATGASDRTVRIWEAETGEEKYQFETKSAVRSVNFAIGDKLLLAAQDSQYGSQPTVFIYDLYDGKTTLNPDMKPRTQLFVEGNRENIVTALWCDLNKRIITAHEDGIVRKWDVETQKVIQKVEVCESRLQSMQYSKDETMIAAASKGDHCAKLLDTKTLEVMKTYRSNRPINAAAISPIFNQVLIGGGIEARDVAVSGRAGYFEVDFWQACFQEYMGSVKGHYSPVNSIDIHPNGKSFVSGAEEGYVRLHHLDQTYLKSSKEMDSVDAWLEKQ